MENQHSLKQQKWFDSSKYPFKSNYLELKSGTLHYIDEGIGDDIILFVHGTPTWSFLYRNQIRKLSTNYRCIALDHLGFGLSEKPAEFDGTVEHHADNLSEFIEKLNLENITLVVHDFGGPIGLSYAIENPDNVDRIVLFNTWMWETKSIPEVEKINSIVNSRLGSFLYLTLNFSPRVLLKQGFHQKENLTKETYKHYTKVFPTKNTRHALLNIAKSLAGSSDWFQSLWEQSDVLKEKPVLILWGMKDQFIKPSFLEKWKKCFSNVEIIEYDCGHFVQEEETDNVSRAISKFLSKTPKNDFKSAFYKKSFE